MIIVTRIQKKYRKQFKNLDCDNIVLNWVFLSPPHTFGKGLTLWHWGSIVINPKVDGGDFVVIQSDVNISENVKIGNYVYLAPGVKVLEGVEIRERVIVGANSVVTKSIYEDNTTWVGCPAHKIKDNGYQD